MSPVGKGVLVILLSGNLLLWGERCAPRPDRSFDFEAFRALALETFPDSELVDVAFEPSPLLPEEYLYLEGAGENPWYSVYVGYYPAPDLTGEKPHDPRLCYRAARFNLLEEDIVELGHPDLERPLFLNRLLAESGSGPGADGTVQASRRIVYFWSHHSGELPTESPGGLAALWQLIGRLFDRRFDLAWIRVEFFPDSDHDARTLPPDLTPEDRDRIYRIMQAAAGCMR